MHHHPELAVWAGHGALDVRPGTPQHIASMPPPLLAVSPVCDIALALGVSDVSAGVALRGQSGQGTTGGGLDMGVGGGTGKEGSTLTLAFSPVCGPARASCSDPCELGEAGSAGWGAGYLLLAGLSPKQSQCRGCGMWWAWSHWEGLDPPPAHNHSWPGGRDAGTNRDNGHQSMRGRLA